VGRSLGCERGDYASIVWNTELGNGFPLTEYEEAAFNRKQPYSEPQNNKSKKDKTKNANNHEGGVPSREQYR